MATVILFMAQQTPGGLTGDRLFDRSRESVREDLASMIWRLQKVMNWWWRRWWFWGEANRLIRRWTARVWRRKVTIWLSSEHRDSDPTRIWFLNRSGSLISRPVAKFTPDPRSRCHHRRALFRYRLFIGSLRRWPSTTPLRGIWDVSSV